MKRVFGNILRIFAAVVACSMVVSCNKEELQGNGISGEVKVDLTFVAKDETATKAENTINDVMVWAFEIDANGNPVDEDGVAVAYVSADFDNTKKSETLTMYIPVSDIERKYRFFAVANVGSFGYLYKAREYGVQPVLELGEHNTYKELSRAAFDATHVASAYSNGNAREASAPMPFSHWKDASFKNGTDNPSTLTIYIYRPVAKTEFWAKVADGSNYTFNVNNIYLYSSKIAIPVQGAVFSDYTGEALAIASSPSIYGDYSDLKVSAQPAPAFLYNTYDNNTPSFTSKVVGATSGLIGSACIYENNHGDSYSQGWQYDFSSPANYTTGSLYMEIHYSYVKKGGNAQDNGEGKCYLPLPRIVRNNNYKINATFDINKEGNLILAYSVEPWTEVSGELEFKYPTIEVSAVKKNTDGTPNYDQPVTKYKANFDYNSTLAPTVEDGAFAFYFKMAQSDIADRKWTVHYTEYTMKDGKWVVDIDSEQGNDFILAVCNNDATGSEKNTILKLENQNHNQVTFTPAGIQYQIRLYPCKPYNENNRKAAEIYITYPALWLGGAADELLINAGGGGTLWTNSGNERYKIGVIQVEDIQ